MIPKMTLLGLGWGLVETPGCRLLACPEGAESPVFRLGRSPIHFLALLDGRNGIGGGVVVPAARDIQRLELGAGPGVVVGGPISRGKLIRVASATSTLATPGTWGSPRCLHDIVKGLGKAVGFFLRPVRTFTIHRWRR